MYLVLEYHLLSQKRKQPHPHWFCCHIFVDLKALIMWLVRPLIGVNVKYMYYLGRRMENYCNGRFSEFHVATLEASRPVTSVT